MAKVGGATIPNVIKVSFQNCPGREIAVEVLDIMTVIEVISMLPQAVDLENTVIMLGSKTLEWSWTVEEVLRSSTGNNGSWVIVTKYASKDTPVDIEEKTQIAKYSSLTHAKLILFSLLLLVFKHTYSKDKVEPTPEHENASSSQER